jgi:hypothetical protein
MAMVMWTVLHQEEAGLLENLVPDSVVTLNYVLHCCGCNSYIFVGFDKLFFPLSEQLLVYQCFDVETRKNIFTCGPS